MNEVFVEQIIKRKLSAKGALWRGLSIAIAAVIGLLAMMLLGMLGVIVDVLLIYLINICWVYTSIEYEYSFLNGELTVDKIIGQRKRKTVDTFDIKNAEVIAPSSSDYITGRAGNIKKLDYSTGEKDGRVYSMIINHNEGLVEVIFEPNGKVLDAMFHVRPSIVKR